VLYGPSSNIEFAYFPQSTIVSVLASTEQGQTTETSIIGREGMIGSSSIHGIMTSFAECIVQVEAKLCASRLRRSIGSDGPARVSEKSLRYSICLCSRSRSNRPPARRCIKLESVPAGMDETQLRQFEPDRQRHEPFDRAAMLGGVGDDLTKNCKCCLVFLHECSRKKRSPSPLVAQPIALNS